MNEELQKQIANMLQAALAAAQKGGEWLAGQIPDVLHQFIVWTIVKGFLSFGFWVAVWVVVISFILNTFKKMSKIHTDLESWQPPKDYCNKASDIKKYVDSKVDDVYFPCIFVFGILGVINFIYTFFMFGNLFDAIQAWIAPKLFLLEYVSHLVK